MKGIQLPQKVITITVSAGPGIPSDVEVVYQVRATACNVSDVTTSVVHVVTVDRLAPDAPANFRAENISNGIYLSWDSVPGSYSYRLVRQYLSGVNWGTSDYWDIYEPECSKTDTGAARDTVYRYMLYAIDEMGNESERVYTFGEHYQGPGLELEGGPLLVTNNGTYSLTGQTEPGATVTVNGSAATVDAEGKFSHIITLSEGTNTITVAATNTIGTHTKTQKVVLDTIPPAIGSLSPSDNTTIGKQRQIYVSASDNNRIELIEIQVSTDDGENWHTFASIYGYLLITMIGILWRY